MNVSVKPWLLSVLCISVLSACGGKDGGLTIPEATYSVTKMNELKVNYHTFRQRSLSAAAPNDSTYVYENSLTGGLIDITFVESSADESRTVDLVVIDIVDINGNYSAISFESVTVAVNGESYTGSYTLIQDKRTGVLSPLTDKGLPILVKADAENEVWNTFTRFSNVADQSRVYLRYGSAKNLHVAELIDGKFVLSQLLAQANLDYWVNSNGDVLSKATAEKALTWLDKSTGQSFIYNNLADLMPYLYDDTFYVKDNIDTVFAIVKTGSVVNAIVALNWSADSAYYASSNSVFRNGYEMKSNCDLFLFDSRDLLNKKIIYKGNMGATFGHVAAAGENTLFCVARDTASNTALPIFYALNTNTEIFNFHQSSVGSSLDAHNRLVVVSDDQLMFSEAPADNFNEYFIKITTGSEVINSVTNASIIKMQHLDPIR